MNNFILRYDTKTTTWYYRDKALESDIEKQNQIFLLLLLENGRENLERQFPDFPFTKLIGKFAITNRISGYWFQLGLE